MNKIDKNELFNKLSKARPEDIKRIGLDNNEIEYIKNKILTTKLGLQLNWEEKDENLDQNYFGLEEINELNININKQERERESLINWRW